VKILVVNVSYRVHGIGI
jgi:ribosomal protein L1